MYSVRPPLLFSGLTPIPHAQSFVATSKATAADAAPASTANGGRCQTPIARNNPANTTTHFAAILTRRRPSASPAVDTPPPNAPSAATRLPRVIAAPPTPAPSAASRPDSRQASAVASV